MRRSFHSGAKILGAFLAVVLLSAFTPAASGPDGASTDGDRPGRFSLIPGGSGETTFTPKALQSDDTVSVILEVSGASVGQQMAGNGGEPRAMSKQQRDRAAAEVQNRQRPVKSQVAQQDGKVLHAYEYAYNGLAVQVAREKLPELETLDNVEGVHPVGTVEPGNTSGVPFIDGDSTWEDTGHTGEDVTIGVIDTGIDYTHANFGGSGDPADFENNDGTVIEPGTFPTEKVVGGHDFVGDEYDASSSDPEVNTPEPDPDPLDCQGHGSHVAGSAAGSGVLAGGDTYGGPYNSDIYDENDFAVGPGVAPDAKLRGYRVFGCSGSASEAVIVAAMDRALEDGVDVVNMSLGSPFGRTDEPSAVAANTLSGAGVTVVASAGNSGPNAYITGAPAIANRAISVAAMDASSPRYPGARLELSTGDEIVAQNSNDADFEDGTTLDVEVLRADDGSVAEGCDPESYQNVEDKLVVTARGTCARVERAIYGQQAGAAAVAMINNAPGYPPFEGRITENPTTGEQVDVTIPFLGVRGVLGSEPTDDGDALVEAGGGTATITGATVPNPGYTAMASFSSGGPRSIDSTLKPDVTAPGVSVASTAVGTGTGATRLSGTSMSAPMVAGSAALVSEARPGYTPVQVKSALMSTAETGSETISGYDPRRAGAGVAQVRKAVTAEALASTSEGRGSLSFEYEPLSGAYSETKTITLSNDSGRAVTYDLAARFNDTGAEASGGSQGAEIAVSPDSVKVADGEQAEVEVTLSLSEDAVAGLPSVATSSVGTGQVLHVKGAVTATPEQAGDGVYALRVPFLAVPRGLSEVEPGDKQGYDIRGGTATTSLPVSNGGVHAGAADVYAWGITDSDEGHATMDVRSVGVQSRPGAALGGGSDDRSLVFAVNTHGRWSNASISEFDILIDTDEDGEPNYLVVGVDIGAVLTGSFTGEMGAFVMDTDGNVVAARYAEAPMNGSTVLLPALASELGLSGDDTDFRYTVNAFSLVPEGMTDTTHSAAFDSHEPALSTGQYAELASGEKTELELSVTIPRFVRTPAFGWLVVSHDDANGGAQAQRVSVLPDHGGPGRMGRLPRPQSGESGKPGTVPEPGPPKD